jgi:transposase
MRNAGEKTREEEIAHCEEQCRFHAQQFFIYTQKLNDLKQSAHGPDGRVMADENEKGGRADTDLTDEQWERIVPLLRSKKRYGRPMVEPRRVINGILYVLGHDCAWNKMPKRYGSYVTCWRRLLRWRSQGIWQQIEQTLMASALEAPPPPPLLMNSYKEVAANSK